MSTATGTVCLPIRVAAQCLAMVEVVERHAVGDDEREPLKQLRKDLQAAIFAERMTQLGAREKVGAA